MIHKPRKGSTNRPGMKYRRVLAPIFILNIAFASLAFLTPAHAQSLIFRPEASVGYRVMPGIHAGGLEQNYGGKVLMEIKPGMRFGIKGDYSRTLFQGSMSELYPPVRGNELSLPSLGGSPLAEHVSFGVVLEQVLLRYFNMGIGTVGNISLNPYIPHSFSIYTHLGFEYVFKNNILILAAYQANFQFENRFSILSAFRLGIGYKLDFKKSGQ